MDAHETTGGMSACSYNGPRRGPAGSCFQDAPAEHETETCINTNTAAMYRGGSLSYERGTPVCTPTEAASEQNLERACALYTVAEFSLRIRIRMCLNVPSQVVGG